MVYIKFVGADALGGPRFCGKNTESNRWYLQKRISLHTN